MSKTKNSKTNENINRNEKRIGIVLDQVDLEAVCGGYEIGGSYGDQEIMRGVNDRKVNGGFAYI